MQILQAFMIFWFLASFGVVPHLLIRLGIWKDWYLTYMFPPLTYRGIEHFGIPFSFLFLFAPCLAFIPVDKETKGLIWLIIGVTGIVIGIILGIWQPGWAKPTWQRRLEEQYDYETIKYLFVPVWRQMNKREWGQLIETEAGMEQLVAMAYEANRGNWEV